MSWTRDTWRKEIALVLFELANIEFQKSIWLNLEPGFQSDFSDLINNLESCGVPEYLNDFIGEEFLDEDQAKLLVQLNELIEPIEEYSSENEYIELWNSEFWREISGLAREVFKRYFEKDLMEDATSIYHGWKVKYPFSMDN